MHQFYRSRSRMMRRRTAGVRKDQTIERGRGETYANDRWTVYEHSTYPSSSVLAGQHRRVWVDDFDTLAEAQRAYPKAVVIGGSTFTPPSLDHLPDGGDL